MYGRPVISQEWSVHAQLTISHSRPEEPDMAPPPSEPHDPGGVHMEYSWGGPAPSPTPNIPAPRPCYGFQRGNILFTTRPPAREPPKQPPPPANLLDSGYSSEQISPGSYASLPTRRPAQPYNRRCKSTCSIVLSGSESQGVTSASLRPNIEEEPACGDPVCYHQATARPKSSDFAPLPETCEVCGGGRSPTAIRRASGPNTFTTHFCTRVPDRVSKEDAAKQSKDAASQTSGSKPYGNVRRKTDSDLLQLPVISLPEPPDAQAKKPSSNKRLSRSPARLRGQSPLAGLKPQQRKPPRTVHIDVYCTGSEDADASGSSDDSEEMSDSFSSPQTVFESEKLRVVHSRMGKDRLPVGYLRRQQQLLRQDKVAMLLSRRSESFKHHATTPEQQQQRGYDSDDGLSSQYPSQMSSSSTLRAATESTSTRRGATSRDPSWSTISTSSMALSDEYDSAAASSWKDTATDLESLVQSSLSLAQSDSFEYADAADRLRIREKEMAWAGADTSGDDSKTWRSPQLERKHLLQQQKLKEFLEKHLGKSPLPLLKTETTEDSDDDETGDAWSFCSPRPSGSTLKREDTVKRVTPKEQPTLRPPSSEKGSLSDSGPHRFTRRSAIGPFGSKSPSPPPSKVPSTITSPFKRSEQLSKAEKFGTIIGAFRKPGHHVGPSKNPECECEHCRKYYEEIGYRTRTRSVGDVPLEGASNVWQVESDLESSITEDASTDTERVLREHLPPGDE